MKAHFIAYGVVAVIFLGLDAIWLATMTGIFYRPILGDQVLGQPRLLPAAVFYAIYTFAVHFLAVRPALESNAWSTALTNGAVLGLVAYATYDLTNQATLKHWPGIVTVVDLAWGVTLTALTATLAYWLIPTILSK